jgi:PBP1b-binding outer membrane lipoprotein LpoB
MKKLSALPVLISTVLLFSCSAEKKLKRRITGEWTAASYTEQNVNAEDGTSENVGTMTFYRNGKGTKNITGIPWRRNFSEGRDFRWQNSANTVTIFDQNSIFAKSWIITVNRRSRQEWKSTDRGNVQTLQLRR